MWTIDQLPDRVAALLAEGYGGQRSGRVRELPNGRAIRWYTTIGLVDRPAAHRGRTALYGWRHLLQVVAVKKLQAAGRTLAEIQGLVVGASDARLAELAELEVGNGRGLALEIGTGGGAGVGAGVGAEGGVAAAAPAVPPVVPSAVPPAPPRSAGFWRDRPAVDAGAAGDAAGDAGAAADAGTDAAPTASAPASPAAAPAPAPAPASPAAASAPAASAPPAPAPPAPAPPAPAPVVVPGLRLAPGVTLLLHDATRTPDPADLTAIAAAAAPLLDLLARTGLAPTTGEDNG
ncbi:MerR family transcriptional regulator [Saccharothrix syringae]|uniref:MerR family transcriptional regulator n=1 Tax=Saccharothrix syringae TaxID=103733 RepID=A0A5Q0HFN3_SACSY|nr:MerR family transcriptional regulator [Saccharothrix syringae]